METSVNSPKSTRKEAIDEYKARKPHRGIFAVRCEASGRVWVGAAPNLEAAKNGAWFTLRIGSHRDAALQAEWRAHGEDAFRFEVLEELDDDVPAMLLRDVLKEKKASWAQRTGGGVLLP
jgi:hypothetical protein